MTAKRSHWALTGLAFLLAGCGAAPHPAAQTATPIAASPPPAPRPAVTPVSTPSEPSASSVTQADFGTAAGRAVSLFTLKNKHGLSAKIMTYGATLTALEVPDRSGQFADVVLGFDSVEQYVKASPYFGATIGRVANRIKQGRFELEGKRYELAVNNPPNHLHGGKQGWDKVIWDARILPPASGAAIELAYVSKAGEEGYPGTVSARVTYTLTDANELRVEFEATTDQTTPLSMAHHSYWNLAGQGSGTVLDQELTLAADHYTPGAPVPDGTIKAVHGTPFDFTAPKAVGKDLEAAGGKPVGFDLNYVVNGPPNELRPVATLKDPKSGRVMRLSADQPGLQLYTGNFLDGSVTGKGGAVYPRHAALCLETQKFPNAINVPAWKDSVVLKPGQTYRHVMIHAFSVE